MELREIEVQRALGLTEFYWITLWTGMGKREEHLNLDQLFHEVFPVAARYVNGQYTCFSVESSPKELKVFTSRLHNELHSLYKQLHIKIYKGVSDKGDLVCHKWIGYNAS